MQSSHLRAARVTLPLQRASEYARETLSAADIEVCHWHLQNFAPKTCSTRFDNPAPMR